MNKKLRNIIIISLCMVWVISCVVSLFYPNDRSLLENIFGFILSLIFISPLILVIFIGWGRGLFYGSIVVILYQLFLFYLVENLGLFHPGGYYTLGLILYIIIFSLILSLGAIIMSINRIRNKNSVLQ